MINQCTYSIICPIRNEEDYIYDLLLFLDLVQPKPIEIILIDGNSKDNTLKIVQNFLKNSSLNILIINNINTIVPHALNLAIPMCTGEIIVRIDAHTKYDVDYFKNILLTFEYNDADIVGGPTRTAFKNSFQESIAYIFNTKLGMGNSSVHDINFKGYTDSVTFGAWRKSIFKTTGMFDINLKRNQDDEFHYRARSLGFKIFQNPDIKLYYYPRSNFRSLFSQYFQYGLFKPMVLKKIKSELKVRHLIPSLFVLYLINLIIFVGMGILMNFIIMPILVYFTLVCYFTFKSKLSFTAKLISIGAYPTIHMAYGIGFIAGIKKII
jgi:glycosyltransferase involved in cell wall biosynthesis